MFLSGDLVRPERDEQYLSLAGIPGTLITESGKRIRRKVMVAYIGPHHLC